MVVRIATEIFGSAELKRKAEEERGMFRTFGDSRVGMVLGAVVMLLGTLLLSGTPVMAGVGGGAVPTWPATATVGEVFVASVTITNTSLSPNNTETVRLANLVVTPACAISAASCPLANADPGIFKINTAAGNVSTPSCAGITFTPGPPDLATGAVQLVPVSEVILGNLPVGGHAAQCQV